MTHPASRWFVLCVTALAFAAAVSSAQGAGRLLVGDPAPALDVDRWLKGHPASSFTRGEVYVLDIWTPWCTPCVEGMPHLSQLQDKLGSRGLVVIGLTSADSFGTTLESATRLVARMGDRLHYRIAWDRGRASYTRWMAREGDNGWPWAFIIDREGRVAWTGHPSGLDPVLERVLAGTWNLDSATTAYRRHAEALDIAAEFYRYFRAQRNELAVAAYQSLRAIDPEMAVQYAPHYFKVLLVRQRRRDDAYAFAREALGTSLARSPGLLFRMASVIADSATAPELRDLDVALECALAAERVGDHVDPGVLETLAQIHAERGDWANAVHAQERALAAADSSDRADLAATLARYREKARWAAR
jgi:thiol-disulfide isomerase/thioredoxin